MKLEWYEVVLAGQVGLTRHVEALRQQRKDRMETADPWGIHMEGACGEYALAKHLNVHWGGSFNTFKEGGDVGASWQVRTRSEAGYQLLIRNDDHPQKVFILVRGKVPEFEIVGWMFAWEAQRHGEWLADHGNYGKPAFFVPDEALHPIAELPPNEKLEEPDQFAAVCDELTAGVIRW